MGKRATHNQALELWLPRFIATGCKNYATESVHLLAGLCADLPKHIAYINTHNRTVNVEGKPGRGKPIDQMMEHYILYVQFLGMICMYACIVHI